MAQRSQVARVEPEVRCRSDRLDMVDMLGWLAAHDAIRMGGNELLAQGSPVLIVATRGSAAALCILRLGSGALT